MNYYASIMKSSLDMGEAMLQTGGEVSRVEDTIRRILSAYGFSHIEVFTITSQINLTATTPEDDILSQFRRIRRWGTDLEKLAELNELSRHSCIALPDPADLGASISAIMSRQESNPLPEYIGSILAAGAFSVFFGGDLVDGFAAGLLAIFIVFLNRRNFYKHTNVLLYFLICSVATGIIANVLLRIGLGHNLDKILIGAVMLTIPGLSTTYSVRDMLQGDTISGLLRFVESLLLAIAIAGGFVFSNMLFGGAI